MAWTVHHYFPLGSDNIGDYLVARAIRRSVTRSFGAADFVDMPVNDRYRGREHAVGLRGANIDRSNAEADLVIVGGSNLLEPRKPRRGGAAGDNPDWGVFTDLDSIHRLKPPLLLVGMGTGSSFGKRIRGYSRHARAEVRLLHERAFAAAVRDVTTVRRLSRVGVSTPCIGCPVTFLTDRRVAPGREDLPLVVSFPPSRIVKRFLGTRFMRGAMRYVEWLRRSGVNVVVTLHEERDQEIVRQWLPAETDVFYTEDVDELIARYEASRGVIGFRLHAALLGLGLGKPVIPVGVDWRGLAFIETIACHDLAIRPFRLAQFGKLRRLTQLLLQGDSRLLTRLDQAKAQLGARYDTFFRDAAGKFTSLARAG